MIDSSTFVSRLANFSRTEASKVVSGVYRLKCEAVTYFYRSASQSVFHLAFPLHYSIIFSKSARGMKLASLWSELKAQVHEGMQLRYISIVPHPPNELGYYIPLHFVLPGCLCVTCHTYMSKSRTTTP